MADIPLTNVAGMGLGMRVTSVESGIIASGVTGDILTIAAPSGCVIFFKILCANTTTAQSGISLSVDSNLLFDQVTLDDNTGAADGNFSVKSDGVSITSGSTASSYSGVIFGLYGKNIVVSKNAGNTLQSIFYAYEIQEPIL